MIDFLSQAAYLPLAVGLALGGTPALVGAMLLVVSGKLSFYVLFVISIITTMLWDAVWYAIGRFIPIEKVEKWSIVKKRQALYQNYTDKYCTHKYKLLFISRFVYGMNSIFSIICGIFRMKFLIFMALSFLSMIIWIVSIYVLSIFFHTNIEILGIADNAKIYIPLFIITMLLVLWGIKKIFFRYMAMDNNKVE